MLPQFRSVRLSSFFRVWHRRVGLTSFIMVLWLAVSGLFLNHADGLSLNTKLINHKLINAFYGLNQSPQRREAFKMNGDYFHCFDGFFYINLEQYSSCRESLQAFLGSESYWVFAAQHEIFIVSANGEFLESVNLEKDLSNIGDMYLVGPHTIFIEADGAHFFRLDLETLAMELQNSSPMVFTAKSVPIKKQAFPLELQSRLEFPGVSLERILLDLHSGRLFGRIGVLVVDVFAFLFIVLSISGLLIYLKKSK